MLTHAFRMMAVLALCLAAAGCRRIAPAAPERPDGETDRVRHEGQKAAPPKTAGEIDPERRAAEWARGLGGAVELTLAGSGRHLPVKHADPLPAAPFKLYLIALTGSTKQVDEGLTHLEGLSVQHLHLAWTTITDAGLARLKGIKNLESIALDNTAVTDAGLAHLRGHDRLRIVALRRTKVTDAGLAHLESMAALKTLHLAGTAATDAGVERLKRALPRLEVTR